MNIRKICGSAFTVTLVGVVNFAAIQSGFSKELATVNGHAITDREVNQALGIVNDRQKEGGLKNTASKDLVLQNLIDQEVLNEEAEKVGLDKDPDIKEAVLNFQKQLITSRLLDKKLSNQITEAAVVKYCKSHKDIFSTDTAHVQQILLSGEGEAKRIKKLAEEQPAQFQDLAEKYSKDPAAKATRGELGFIAHDRLVKEFTDLAFATADGKIAGPVKTAYGYHVIKVIEKKKGRRDLDCSEVELRARDALRADLIREYTNKLRAQASIKIGEGS